jgi:hypothetical protein
MMKVFFCDSSDEEKKVYIEGDADEIICHNVPAEKENEIEKEVVGDSIEVDKPEQLEMFGIRVIEVNALIFNYSYGAFWGKINGDDIEFHEKRQPDSCLLWYADNKDNNERALLEAIKMLENEGLITVKVIIWYCDENENGYMDTYLKCVAVVPKQK